MLIQNDKVANCKNGKCRAYVSHSSLNEILSIIMVEQGLENKLTLKGKLNPCGSQIHDVCSLRIVYSRDHSI